MRKSAFIEIIKTFDKDELKRFDSFLNSPYFNTRSYTIKLFDELKKYAPQFEDAGLEKENLWIKLFPGKRYNYGMMKNIIFDLTKFAEKFLEIEKFNSDENMKFSALLEKLTEKNLYEIFMMKYGSFEKKKFSSSKIHLSYYRDYNDLKSKLSDLGNLNAKYRRRGLIDERIEHLVLDFLFSFGILYNEFCISDSDFNENSENKHIRAFAKLFFDNERIDKFTMLFKTFPERNFKVIQIIFKLMKSFLSPHDVSAYIEAKQTIKENHGYIELNTLRILYSCLVSALDNCKDTINFNSDEEYFDIFKKLIEYRIYATDTGKVEPSLFLASIKTAAKVKQPEFIESICKNFLGKISPELRDNMKIYADVYLHYSKDEFEESLKYLNKINIDTHPMKFNLKNLQILISYEIKDYDMFVYLKDSYKHFLSKNRSVSESYRESNLKFIKYTDNLFKISETKNKNEKEYLRKIISGDTVPNKQWILEKLDRII